MLILAIGWVPREVWAADVAELFNRVQELLTDIPTGLPSQRQKGQGPKGLAVADFDDDTHMDLAISSTDGSITLYYGLGDGSFDEPEFLDPERSTLRGILATDLNRDGKVDIVVAGPTHGTNNVAIFWNMGTREFSPPTYLSAWRGARNLSAGDFDGDGIMDLIVAGQGVGLRQYRGTGGGEFEVLQDLPEFNFTSDDPNDFPKPVYSLKTFRLPEDRQDRLVVTHAETNRTWILTAPTNTSGRLYVESFFESSSPAHALAVGPILSSKAAGNPGLPDLITVQRDEGKIEVHRGRTSEDGSFYFSQEISQPLAIPGGPRAAEIVDLDQDGWNDLVVVQRNFDNVLTYRNQNGSLSFATVRPVGESPRELVAANLDADEYPDLVVINRNSANASILLAFPGEVGFRGFNHLYLVDGNVVGLAVVDFNRDCHDDVIQLHRASGDFSVRLANPDGTLQEPVYYTVGNVPSAQVVIKVNNDDYPDLVTANLGIPGVENGSVTLRLGNGDGTFGLPAQYFLPPEAEGRLFALVPGDFDGDGNVDLAAGYLDSRIAFFQNVIEKGFIYRQTISFAHHARSLVVADFDGDKDPDLAGVGITGDLWVIENPKSPIHPDDNFFTVTDPTYTIYPRPDATNTFGGRRIIVTDQNKDEDPDLVMGSGQGAWLYMGGPGLSFVTPPVKLAGVDHFISDMLLVNLDRDQDGNDDLVIGCRDQDCVSYFSGSNKMDFNLEFLTKTPASKFLTTGDLDGDGELDLVGSGRVLWTALSSRAPTNSAPLELASLRPAKPAVVFNEILAINNDLPVQEDKGRKTDWVEMYNGSDSPLFLGGWRIEMEIPADLEPTASKAFSFPLTAFLPGKSHLLIVFGENIDSFYHTGFPLPGDGATLILIDPAGTEIDRVTYPPQRSNISYARFQDGVASFVFNPFPSPDQPNTFNGDLVPEAKFLGVDPASLQVGEAIRFFVEAAKDANISSIRMFYQRLDDLGSPGGVLDLWDDGVREDGTAFDGLFAGDLDESLPAPSELQFYFELTDLNDQVVQIPEEPTFGGSTTSGNLYQLGLGFPRIPLELSELVSLNVGGLTDTNGGTPDWVEVRNTSATSLNLAGLVLCQQLGDVPRFHFPEGAVLQPGEHLVVYCDGSPNQGPLHAPFRLSSAGDLVMLSAKTANGSWILHDWVAFGPLTTNQAFARLGVNGKWRVTEPTPFGPNLLERIFSLDEGEAGEEFLFAFPTQANATYTIEYRADLEPGIPWNLWQTFTSNGIEYAIRRPLGRREFFRVLSSP